MDASNGASPRLKSLELQGYKTFAGKSLFVFAPTVTAIVGPNGSGKSNIADAIRWVLGEQSYSLLRGKKTEDMIFAGSETRPRAGMAAATITFDNSNGWLPIDFTEVSISRRAYRDAQNEYFLNAQRVRLRDVSELLSACGLAQRTYTVIGQGLVDAVLSLKAEERRRLFEEAAGIGLYRSRREEALRRLEATRHNLERVQDILAELTPRLRSLERQARRAQEYDQVRNDLKDALRVWYGFHWSQLQRVVSDAREEAGRHSQAREELRLDQAATDRELTEARGRIETVRAALHQLTQRLTAVYAEREALGRKLAVAQERLRGLSEQDGLTQAELTSLEATAAELQQRLEEARGEVGRRQAAHAAAEAELRQLRAPHAPGEPDRPTLQARLNAARQRLDEVSAERAAWTAQNEQLEQRLQAADRQAAELGRELAAAEAAVAAAQAQVEAARRAQEQARQMQQEAQQGEAARRQALAEAEAERGRLATRSAGAQAQHASLSARVEVLRRPVGSAEQVASRLAAEAASGRLAGLVSSGRLGQQLHVTAALRPAILAALGEFGEGLAFRSPEDIGAALEWLSAQNRAGRAALLPLASARIPPVLPPAADEGCLGNAAVLADPAPEYRRAVEMVLGRTLVARDRAAARRLLAGLPADGRVVTLAGEVFYPGGAVVVGLASGTDGTAEALRQAEAELERSRGAAQAAERALAERSQAAEAARTALERAVEAVAANARRAQETQLRLEQAGLAERAARAQREFLAGQLQRVTDERAKALEARAALQGRGGDFEVEARRLQAELQAGAALLEGGSALRATQAEAKLQLARSAAAEGQARLGERGARLAAVRSELEARHSRQQANHQAQAEARGEATEAAQSLEGVERVVSELEAEVRRTEAALAAAEQERTALEGREGRARAELQEAERRHSQTQIELARRQQELAGLKQRIEDDFGLVAFQFDEGVTVQEPLPLDGLVEHLPVVESLPPELEGQVARLRLQLRRMGAVNPEARREYEEVRQRVEFLTTQVDDSRRAESQIQEVIAELDHLMEREFRKTFEAVATAFRQSFARLFGGGSARLMLTDESDLTNTGIDIEARLPGRREHGLAMLSGGERSLTASALIFALLKVSPTPFCVLDEVDAMLDESNVGRFCEMLRELSLETQFLVITHNRQTIQMAEVVYGISMGPDSASRVIGLKLDEEEKEIRA